MVRIAIEHAEREEERETSALMERMHAREERKRLETHPTLQDAHSATSKREQAHGWSLAAWLEGLGLSRAVNGSIIRHVQAAGHTQPSAGFELAFMRRLGKVGSRGGTQTAARLLHH